MTRNGKNMGRSRWKKERQRQSLLRKTETQKSSTKTAILYGTKDLCFETVLKTEWLSSNSLGNRLCVAGVNFFIFSFSSLFIAVKRKSLKKKYWAKTAQISFFLRHENLFLISSLIPFHSLQWAIYFTSQRLFPVFFSKTKRRIFCLLIVLTGATRENRRMLFFSIAREEWKFYFVVFVLRCLTCRTQDSLESSQKL